MPDEEFISEINETLRFLADKMPDTVVIFRNTAPGHADFEKYFHAKPWDIPHNTTNDAHYDLTWKWEEFQGQNVKLKRLLDDHYPNYLYMDIDYMTRLRPDGHRDPLHYCIPGPMRGWTELFFQILDMLGRPTMIDGLPEYNVTGVENVENLLRQWRTQKSKSGVK